MINHEASRASHPALFLEIHGLPKILSNGSQRNFWARENEKKRWKGMAIAAVRLKAWFREPLKKARIVFTRYSSREPDSDNLAISFKAIRDGLVQAGVIIDDKPSVLEAIYKWQKASPKQGRITIEVYEVTP